MHKHSNAHLELDAAAELIQDAIRLIRNYSERKHHVPTEMEILAFHLVADMIRQATIATDDAGRQLTKRQN